MAVALAAKRRGAEVLVLEKQRLERHTPNVRLSGGIVMTLTNAAAGAEYLTACSGDRAEIDAGWITVRATPGEAPMAASARLVLTATADDASDINIQLPRNRVTNYNILVRGGLLGGCNSHYDIPRLARRYAEGQLKLAKLITRRYTVGRVAQGYDDVRNGKVIRGLVEHHHE